MRSEIATKSNPPESPLSAFLPCAAKLGPFLPHFSSSPNSICHRGDSADPPTWALEERRNAQIRGQLFAVSLSTFLSIPSPVVSLFYVSCPLLNSISE